MIVAVSGASGFIGKRVATALTNAGHVVRPLVRAGVTPAVEGAIVWGDTLDPRALADVDAVIHLAGEPIAQRWTPARKQRILDSRVRGTKTIARVLAAARPQPAVLLSGSAIGIYGDRDDELLDETSDVGEGFLAQVAAEWERATDEAQAAGVRVVHLRTGLVLGTEGGALAKMLPLFRARMGGRMGSGRQWVSWIAGEDLVQAMLLLLQAPGASGAVNLVAPEPVRNAEFAHILGLMLGCPTVLPVPRFALTLALGEMARETVLASQHVVPKRLGELGFQFRFPNLAEALGFELQP